MSFEQFVASVEKNELQGVWIAGGYVRHAEKFESIENSSHPLQEGGEIFGNDWIDESTAKKFQLLSLLVLQDLFPSPLVDRATYVLPAGAFAEREGSYVNRDDRLQTATWAIRPPLGVRTEGSLLWEMSGRKGLYDAKTVLAEIAREIPYFSAAVGDIPDIGIDLKINWLAENRG